MAEIFEKVEYWATTSQDDLGAAEVLLDKSKTRHGLFFVHLSVEKMAKACFCQHIKKEPPRIHNIVRISELAGLIIPDDIRRLMARINEFCLEGRYPWIRQIPLTYINR